MAHRRQKTRLGEIGAFGAPPRLVRVQLRLFQFGDERLLLGLIGQAGERRALQPIGEKDEIGERAAAEQRQRFPHQAIAPGGEDHHDRQHRRQQGAADGEGNRRGDDRRHGRDQHQDRQHEAVRVRIRQGQQLNRRERPEGAREDLDRGEHAAPAPGRTLRRLRREIAVGERITRRRQRDQRNPQQRRRQGHREIGGHAGEQREQAEGRGGGLGAQRELTHQSLVGTGVFARTHGEIHAGVT